MSDQEYVIEGAGRLPSGYHNAVSPSGDRRGETCVIHTRRDMEPVEPEEPEESENPNAMETPEPGVEPPEPVEPQNPWGSAEPEPPAVEPEQPSEGPAVQPEVPEENQPPVLPPNPFEQNMTEPMNNTPAPNG